MRRGSHGNASLPKGTGDHAKYFRLAPNCSAAARSQRRSLDAPLGGRSSCDREVGANKERVGIPRRFALVRTNQLLGRYPSPPHLAQTIVASLRHGLGKTHYSPAIALSSSLSCHTVRILSSQLRCPSDAIVEFKGRFDEIDRTLWSLAPKKQIPACCGGVFKAGLNEQLDNSILTRLYP